jgi:hypothetical protein
VAAGVVVGALQRVIVALEAFVLQFVVGGEELTMATGRFEGKGRYFFVVRVQVEGDLAQIGGYAAAFVVSHF